MKLELENRRTDTKHVKTENPIKSLRRRYIVGIPILTDFIDDSPVIDDILLKCK
jgi:hypothetical protein